MQLLMATCKKISQTSHRFQTMAAHMGRSTHLRATQAPSNKNKVELPLTRFQVMPLCSPTHCRCQTWAVWANLHTSMPISSAFHKSSQTVHPCMHSLTKCYNTPKLCQLKSSRWWRTKRPCPEAWSTQVASLGATVRHQLRPSTWQPSTVDDTFRITDSTSHSELGVRHGLLKAIYAPCKF